MESVLIVDDHASYRAIARTLLERAGFVVVGEAADGLSAVVEAARLRPDVVLLDVQLPDDDGFLVSARLRSLEGAPAVVLISSRDWSGQQGRIEASGAAGFVTKEGLSLDPPTGGGCAVGSGDRSIVGCGRG